MNILIISHAAGIPEIGPNLRTFYLGRNLIQKGHNVSIVGSGNFHKYKNSPLENGKYTTKNVEGINYHWLPTYNYKKRNHQQVINQIHFAHLLRTNKKKWLAFNPDVIIVSSPHPFGIYAGKYLAKKCNAKLIFEVRDLWPEIIEELGNFKKSHPYLKMISHAVKTAYKYAHGIVSVKPGDVNYIQNNYNVKGKVKFIPNGFDHAFIQDEAFEHPVFERNTFKIIYTGALSNYYAIEYLLYAAEKLKYSHPQIEIIIAGDGEDKKAYETIQIEKQLNNVIFLGFLPKKNMLSIIRNCDIAFLGLRDTKANRFGISTNKLYEYMFAKKPILASYSTDYDIIQETGCGLSVQPENVEAIYNAVVKFFDMSQSERDSMGQKGYECLLKNHTFEVITEQYLNFIQEI